MDTNTAFDIVIGLTGLKAAGKDELCRHLAGQGFVTRGCGDEIREVLRQQGNASPTIDQQIEMGNKGRQESGDIGYWAKRVLETLRAHGHRMVIVNGLRHPDEVRALQSVAGDALALVSIVAPTNVRADRLISRGRNGDPKTIEEFLRLDDTDRGNGQPWHGQQVDRTRALVPHGNEYNNAGTREEYHAWIDAFIRRLQELKLGLVHGTTF